MGTTNNWTNTGSWSNGILPNSAGSIANFIADFGSTASGINIGTDNITVGQITMTDTATATAGRFNIVSSAGGILTLDNGATVPVLNYTTGGQFDNFINAVVGGTNGLQKTGAGVVQLRGYNNTYTGTTIITAGALRIDRNLSLGDAANGVQFAGGRLNLVSGTVNLTNRAISVTAGNSSTPSQLQTEGSSSLEISGNFSSSAGTYFRKTDTGTLVFSGTANAVGRIEFNGGTANLSGTFSNTEGVVITKLNANNANSIVNWSGTGTLASGSGAAFILNDGGTNATVATLNVTAGTLNVGDGVNSGRFVVGGKGIGAANVMGGTLSVMTNKDVSIGSFFQFGGNGGNGTLTISNGGLFQALGAGSFFVGYGQDAAAAGGAFGGTGVLNLNTGGTLETGRNITTGTNATGTVNFDGGTLKAAADNANLLRTTNNRVGNGGLTIDTAGFNIGISQVLASNGTGGLTKTGSGTLTLGAANTYSGGTLVSAGTLSGDTTSLQGGITNNALAIFDQATNGTYAGSLAGSGALSKSGSGTLILTGANVQGSTLISSGTLQVGAGGTAGSLSGAITNNASLAFNRSDNLTNLSAISGSGVVGKLGAGTLTLGGASTYSGGTLVSAGALAGSSASLQGAITNNAAVIFDQSTNGTYAGAMSGNGTLTKSAAGTLTLSGANTYSGGTLVSAGGLSGSSASLQGVITNNGAVSFDQTTNGTYNGLMSGTGSLTKSGNGTLTVAGANTYSGTTTISGGGVTLGAGAAISTNTVTFAGTAGVVLNLGGNSQSVGLVNNNLSNSATTLTISNGSLTISGATNQTFGATVNGSGTDLSGLSNFTFNGATSDFQINANGANVTNTVQFAKLGTNTISAANVRWGGGGANVAGQNSLVRLGQDNVINAGSDFLVGFFQGSGNASFAEGITNGTLTIRGAGGGSAPAPLIRIGQGNSGNQSAVGVLNLTGGSIDALASEFDVGVHAANASGTTGTGTLTMPDGTIVAGTMSLGRKTATTGSATATGTVNQSGGTVTATNLYLGNSAASGADLPNLVANYNLTGGTLYAQTIGGNGANYGASTVRDLNVNGGTVQNISGSDLTINGLANTASGRINVVLGNSGGAFLADAGRSITIGGNALVSGIGALSKQGGGTLTLATNNTYTGTTTVEAGTLVVNGSLASSAVTVESGGTLGGSGSLGLVTIEQGGTISPGNSPGTLTLTNGLDWNAGGHYNWQIFDATGIAGTGWDLIDITGGSWDINGLSSDNPFNINLWSLSATNPDSSGLAINFNAAQTNSWKILAATSISGTFNTNLFTINTGAFNGTAGFSGSSGLFSLALDENNDLFLNYAPGAQAVPEPGTWAAAALLAGLAGYLRRRRAAGK